MARDWEATLRAWSGPSSETEQQKQERTHRMVKDAIKSYPGFASKTVEVFVQGSYCNKTNVRQDSDVDICVRLMDVFFSNFDFAPAGLMRESLNVPDATYTYKDFKSDVGAALILKFGSKAIVRGNKAFDVTESTARVEADVVPTFEHRRYVGRHWFTADPQFLSGTEFLPDKGGSVVNWPHQHLAEGNAKNSATHKRFKKMVRALKRVRYEMEDKGITAAAGIPSFLIECLVYNVPDDHFGIFSYRRDMRNVLAYAFDNTKAHRACAEWTEVSRMKLLFDGTQNWSRQQANQFVLAAWRYMGFDD